MRLHQFCIPTEMNEMLVQEHSMVLTFLSLLIWCFFEVLICRLSLMVKSHLCFLSSYLPIVLLTLLIYMDVLAFPLLSLVIPWHLLGQHPPRTPR